jgi:hypothetical protein
VKGIVLSLRARLPIAISAIALAAVASLAVATSAQAEPAPSVSFSATEVYPGSGNVTYTLTTAQDVSLCYYINGDAEYPGGDPYSASFTSQPFDYDFLQNIFPGSTNYIIAVFPGLSASCPSTSALALSDGALISSTTLGILPTPPAPPAPPAPEEPTLAVTGVDAEGALSLGAVLLALGAATLLVRRKRARA